MTTFLHARDNGYKDFWNIDADDIDLCAKPRRISKLLKHVKDYANNHDIKLFSLDMWRTHETTRGKPWNFGVAYTDNTENWFDLLKTHCNDREFINEYNPPRTIPSRNVDYLFTYLGNINLARIETFYVENLRMIHHRDNFYINSQHGMKYWKNGRCYFTIANRIMGYGEKDGSLPIPEDIIKLDVGFSEKEMFSHLKFRAIGNWAIQIFDTAANITDAEVTAILALDNNKKNILQTLESLSAQTFKDFRLIVTDAGLNETALKTCRELESKFNGRMKIITGLKKENLLGAGLQAAKGRYVIFINGNDVFVPQAFQILNGIIEGTRADVVHTSNFLVPNADKTLALKTDEPAWGNYLQSIIFLKRLRDKFGAWANGAVSPSIFNKLIRREFLEEEKISLPFTDVMTQWTFSLQCLMLAENYVRVPQPLYVRTTDTPAPNFTKDFPARIKSLAKCYEALDKLDDEVFYFDEYANEKNILKNLFNKNFINEV